MLRLIPAMPKVSQARHVGTKKQLISELVSYPSHLSETDDVKRSPQEILLSFLGCQIIDMIALGLGDCIGLQYYRLPTTHLVKMCTQGPVISAVLGRQPSSLPKLCERSGDALSHDGWRMVMFFWGKFLQMPIEVPGVVRVKVIMPF